MSNKYYAEKRAEFISEINNEKNNMADKLRATEEFTQ
jgi:hypothetical protein